jgi:hypothetical protein
MAVAPVGDIEISSIVATLRGARVVPGTQCKRGASLMNDEPGDVWIDVSPRRMPSVLPHGGR